MRHLELRPSSGAGGSEVVLEGCGACNGTPLLIVRQVQDPRKVSSEEDLERAWLRGF